MKTIKAKTKSNIFLLIAAVIWGLAFVAQCEVAGKINIFLFLGTRYILGALSILPVIFMFENKNENKNKDKEKPNLKLTVLSGILCGVILFTASFLQQFGINMSPNAGKAGFITGIYTVLVPILYFVLFRKKTGWNVCLGAVCAVLGLYFLSVTNGIGSIKTSDKIIFIGSVFWAFHIITIDKFINKISPLKFSFVQFLTSGILGLMIVVSFGNISFAQMLSQIAAVGAPLLYVGVCSSGIAYTCQVLGQRGADPTYSAIILSSESVFAAIGGAVAGVDDMSLRSYLGCAIIFAGILISQINPVSIIKNKKASKDQS